MEKIQVNWPNHVSQERIPVPLLSECKFHNFLGYFVEIFPAHGIPKTAQLTVPGNYVFGRGREFIDTHCAFYVEFPENTIYVRFFEKPGTEFCLRGKCEEFWGAPVNYSPNFWIDATYGPDENQMTDRFGRKYSVDPKCNFPIKL